MVTSEFILISTLNQHHLCRGWKKQSQTTAVSEWFTLTELSMHKFTDKRSDMNELGHSHMCKSIQLIMCRLRHWEFAKTKYENSGTTYSSSSHHFHQNMSCIHCIVKRRRYTGHWSTGTGWKCNLTRSLEILRGTWFLETSQLLTSIEILAIWQVAKFWFCFISVQLRQAQLFFQVQN